MEIDLALLADAATIDASGKLNILGIFDRIQSASFPARHGRVSLVLRFSGGMDEAGEHEVAIRLVGPDGEEVVGLDGTLQLAPGPGAAGGAIRVPHVLNLDGLVFPMEGRYTFEIRVDGVHELSLPLTVSGRGGAAGGGASRGGVVTGPPAQA